MVDMATRNDSEVEAQLARARELVLTIGQQSESAAALVADLGVVSAGARDASAQARDGAAQVAAALEVIRSTSTAATESASRIEALRTQVEQTAQVAAQRSEHIEDGRKYIDERRADVDAVLNAAKLSATNAEAQHQGAKATADKLEVVLATSQAACATIEAASAAVAVQRLSAEKDSAATARLAEIASVTEKRIAEYESKLGTLQAACEAQRAVIEGLLLGATNAGLAAAFHARAKTFKSPQLVWQRIFVGSLLVLLLLAGIEVWVGEGGKDWSDLMRMVVHRLPFLIPLVWLALYSSWQASLASRMEEEYAFKATLATSFEGFRRQMADVGTALALDSPLARLCTNTLSAIAEPPGRIYDKHGKAPTPGTAAAETVAPFVSSATSALGGKPPK